MRIEGVLRGCALVRGCGWHQRHRQRRALTAQGQQRGNQDPAAEHARTEHCGGGARGGRPFHAQHGGIGRDKAAGGEVASPIISSFRTGIVFTSLAFNRPSRIIPAAFNAKTRLKPVADSP